MSDIPLVRTDEFEIRGEFLWFGVILHGDFYVPWTKGVRERFLRAFKAILRDMAWTPAYAFQAPSHDPKKRKFIKDIGGVFDHFRLTGDGEWAEMYRFRPLDPIQRN